MARRLSCMLLLLPTCFLLLSCDLADRLVLVVDAQFDEVIAFGDTTATVVVIGHAGSPGFRVQGGSPRVSEPAATKNPVRGATDESDIWVNRVWYQGIPIPRSEEGDYRRTQTGPFSRAVNHRIVVEGQENGDTVTVELTCELTADTLVDHLDSDTLVRGELLQLEWTPLRSTVEHVSIVLRGLPEGSDTYESYWLEKGSSGLKIVSNHLPDDSISVTYRRFEDHWYHPDRTRNLKVFREVTRHYVLVDAP